ncbi:Calx-beta domain-containing protein [Flavobacterium sp. CS20]|uniref:beta strand repeat-containing protein n=1 Tax=Flavobacterium sp. CS20 TaxID=2775246 RepID=UPI001B3A1968|nr:Calx-beta domain-containing protein [Flavobacterium sp. CS20]QTY26263.1 hypothetical protein IGB25_09880 [Flavobacterium sp. CS20]
MKTLYQKLLLIGVLALLAIPNAFGQTTIYNADFSNEGDGFADHTTSNPPAPAPASVGPFGTAPNSWILSYTSIPGTDGTANSFKVVGGVLKSDDWGGQGIFESQVIDVSGMASVDISATSVNSGANDDNFTYFYILDGGARVNTNIGATITSDAVNYNVLNLDVSATSTLVVGFEFNENGGGDGYETSSFTVTGTPLTSDTQVNFASASTSVLENAGSVDLTLSITNEDDTNPTSVDVILTTGNSTDIGNYTTQTVTFPAGSVANQTLTVNVTDNAIDEADKNLTFTLQNVTGGTNAQIGAQNTFDLTIQDDELARPIALPYNEDFASCATAEWTAFDQAGSNSWTCGGGEYAMNGFSGGTGDDIDWLVSDFRINFDDFASVTIAVTTAEQFGGVVNEPGEFRLVYSTDYDGLGNPTTATWTDLTFDPNNTSTGSGLSAPSTFNVDASGVSGTAFLAFIYDETVTGADTEDWRIQNINIISGSTPIITLSETSLSGFTYEEGNGPSSEQTFTVEGTNLSGDLNLTAPTNFEISTTSGSGFANSIALTPTSGEVATTTIYVRLSSGLTVNTFSGTLTATSSGALQQDLSLAGEVTVAGLTTIAIEDFDGSTPSWTFSNDILFFDNGTDGKYGVFPVSTNPSLNNPNFSQNVLFENDLDDEGDNGTTGFATVTFEEISVVNFSNITLSFDWQVINYNANNDDAKYEIIVDGVSQGEVFLVDGGVDATDGSGSVSFNVPDNSTSVSLLISVRNNGGDGFSAFDNIKLEGVYNGDLIYTAGAWSPNAPSASTGADDALVQDGTYVTSGDINLNSISVLSGANVEISSGNVLNIGSSINNNGTFTFKSDATSTAQLADASGVSITGNVTVERFIPAGDNTLRAFRFLASPVTTSNSIRMNWQEGVASNTDDPNPGFGTHITGSTIDGTNGFDGTISGNPSLLLFDNSTQIWSPIDNTDVNTLEVGNAYNLFVRGDRSVDLTSSPQTPTNTTLRATGSLTTGSLDLSSSLATGNAEWSLLGNPYQAIVDFNALTFNGDINSNMLFIWNPNASTQGAYEAIDNADQLNK